MKILIVILLLLLLVGCNDLDKFKEKHQDLKSTAIKECSRHGQNYEIHYTYDLENFEVQCYTKSPIKFYYYRIE